jgi:hypothetical protein
MYKRTNKCVSTKKTNLEVTPIVFRNRDGGIKMESERAMAVYSKHHCKRNSKAETATNSADYIFLQTAHCNGQRR